MTFGRTAATAALLAALAASHSRAKSVDDFVGVYTPPVSEASGALREPKAGMAVNSNSMTAVAFAYDRFCGLADLTSADFVDADAAEGKTGAEFPFAPSARRREIADGSDLGVEKFDRIVAAAGAFLSSGGPVQAATGGWTTTPLYCPAASDYAGSLFRAGERTSPPYGTLEGAPCRGSAGVPCLGAEGGADTSMAAVGTAFAEAVGGTFEAEGGVDYMLDDHFDGDGLFDDGALKGGADGAAALRAEPWTRLAGLANGMNAWAAFLDESLAKFRMRRSTRSRTVSFTVSPSGGEQLDVSFDVQETAGSATMFDADAAERSCTMSKADGNAPKNADGDVEFEVQGTVEAIYGEIVGQWQLDSVKRYSGYTMRTYKRESAYSLHSRTTTWTEGLGTYTVGSSTLSECVPVSLVDETDARLLTDAQRAYYGTGRILVGGRTTTRRQGEAEGTERYTVAEGSVSPGDGYAVKSALGAMLEGYAKNDADENDIANARARIMMEDAVGGVSVSYSIPDTPAPAAPTYYRYEYVYDSAGGGASTNSYEYVGPACECYISGCACERSGIRCDVCRDGGCDCCFLEPDPKDDYWHGGDGDGGGTGGDGDGGGTGGGDQVVSASASATVRIPAAGTNSYSYLRTATAPRCLVFARINSAAGGSSGGGVDGGGSSEAPCDIYVDGGAPGKGDGSRDSPFSSLDDAVDAADPSKSGAASAQSARAASSASGASSNAVKRIGIRRGVYDLPKMFNRSPFAASTYPVELVGLDDGVVIRKTMRYATGAFDADGQPLTAFRNLTVEMAYAGQQHRTSFLVLDGCRITGAVRSCYSVVEASVIRDCAFEGLSFEALAVNGSDVMPFVFGSDVSNCTFEVSAANPAVTSLAEASRVADCLVRGGEFGALQSFDIGQGGQGGFERCTFCPSNVLAQAVAAKDDQNMGTLAMTDCIVFVDGFTNEPPRVVGNMMTNRAAAAEVLNPMTWRPRAEFREWRRKGWHSAR